MATIGHTLTGLSLAGCGTAKARGGTLPYLWPAVIVLLAHAVDLIEWGYALVSDAPGDGHFLTNSALATGAVVLLVWLVLALVARARSLAVYAIVAGAVFSHLLLDAALVRRFVAETYAGREIPGLLRFEGSFVAEVWLFGLVFVLIALTRAVSQRQCPPKGRLVGYVLGLASIAAAVSRLSAVWVPVYVLSLLHAALLLRSSLHVRQLWGVVAVTPVLAFVLLELVASQLTSRGLELYEAGRYPEAAVVQRQVLKLPVRQSHAWHHFYLANTYRGMKQPDLAEMEFLAAIRADDQVPWPRIYLARMYGNPNNRAAGLFRPREAKVLYQRVLSETRDDAARECARQEMTELENASLDE